MNSFDLDFRARFQQTNEIQYFKSRDLQNFPRHIARELGNRVFPYWTFCCVVSLSIFTRCLYFDSPYGLVKIRHDSDLLSNIPNSFVCADEFRGYLFTGKVWQKYARRNGIGAGNPANWLVNNSRTRQTVFFGFDHAITGAIYFTLHNEKKSSLDRPNYTSI